MVSVVAWCGNVKRPQLTCEVERISSILVCAKLRVMITSRVCFGLLLCCFVLFCFFMWKCHRVRSVLKRLTTSTFRCCCCCCRRFTCRFRHRLPFCCVFVGRGSRTTGSPGANRTKRRRWMTFAKKRRRTQQREGKISQGASLFLFICVPQSFSRFFFFLFFSSFPVEDSFLGKIRKMVVTHVPTEDLPEGIVYWIILPTNCGSRSNNPSLTGGGNPCWLTRVLSRLHVTT